MSKVQADLCLEHAMTVAFGLDASERRGAVGGQIRDAHVGMVDDIGGVHAELEGLRFREPDDLSQRRVKICCYWKLHRLLAESSSMSRLGLLKHDLIGCGIRDRE